MADLVHPHQQSNKLLNYSLKHPVWMMLVLFIIASLIKTLDAFVLPLNELVGELIITKALGFVMIVVFLWACGRRLSDIGFHTRALGRSLLVAGVCVIALFIIPYAVQYIALRASGEEAAIVLKAEDPKTGLSGGLAFGMWMLIANLVNSAMEEGLFRGLMIRHFRIPFAILGTMLLQTFLFAIWHLNWPVENLVSGESTLGEAAFEAASLLVGTGLAALVYGTLYLKTNNLWAPFFAHTINNSALNFLFFRTSEGLDSGPNFGLFIAVWLPLHLLLIPVIIWLSRRLDMPEVKPWGDFEEDSEMAPAAA